jgi:group II intron reverse transcriptase/maturase
MASFYEEIFSLPKLESAWARVEQNHGAAGVDGVTIEAFAADLSGNLNQLGSELMHRSYYPCALRRAYLPKTNGGERPIAIATLRDRVVQQALLQALTPLFEPDFLESSFGYRSGRSAHDALDKVESLIREGKHWVLRADIESFFDRMDHQLLIDFLKERVPDDEVIEILVRSLKVLTLDGMKIAPQVLGAPQGLPISPLLANIYLHRLDTSLAGHGYAHVRYADDWLVLGDTPEICHQARTKAEETLTALKLKLNAKKTSIQRVAEGFVFLGYRIDLKGRGPSQKSLSVLGQRLDESASLHASLPLKTRLALLEDVIRGWSNYYGRCLGVPASHPLAVLALARACVQQGEGPEGRKYLSRIQRCAEDADFIKEVEALRRQVGPPEVLKEGEASPEAKPEAQAAASTVHEKISRLRQLLRSQPDFAEGYRELAESYAATGQYGLAKQAFEQAMALQPEISDVERETHRLASTYAVEDEAVRLSDEQVALFLKLFSGREGVYARQWVDSEGRRGFAPVVGNLTADVLRGHFDGGETLGVYPIRKDNTVQFVVIDIDIDKKILIESGGDPTSLAALEQLTQKDACRLASLCEKWGIPVYIEDSGYKGRHCWVFFSEPVQAEVARRLAKNIMEVAGAPAGGLHREVFPNQDRVKEGRLGNLIKLPLGIHKKTGRRCRFLDASGQPYSDQLAVVETIQTLSVNKAARLAVGGGAEGPEPAIPQSDLLPPTPEIAALLEGCAIIRHLVDKAEDTRYLNHWERLSLLCTLGHLGDPGKAYLHRVIAKTVNYDFDVTEKYIRKMKPSPISCARIREMFHDLPETVRCSCDFVLPPRGYPSPVLYAMGVKRKSAGSKQRIQVATAKKGSPAPAPGHAARPSEPPRSPKPSDPTDLPAAISGLLNTYLELKRKMHALDEELRAQEAKLGELFDKAAVEGVDTELGTLRRQQDGTGTKWLIEV